MAKGKIAPTLREVIGVEARISWNRQTAEQANAELKALLDCATTLRWFDDRCLCASGRTEGRVRRALARLDRVSSKGDDK